MELNERYIKRQNEEVAAEHEAEERYMEWL